MSEGIRTVRFVSPLRFSRDADHGLSPGYELPHRQSPALEPMGVVDIGSNSVRLVVYEGAVRAPAAIFNEKVQAGLGRTIASTGVLDPDAVARTLEGLARFRAILGILRVKHLRAIATAACREASNGASFISSAQKALGAPIEVLSGVQEAELAANGILMGFEAPDGLTGDLGGGSLELIDIDGRALKRATTLPLGSLRLIDASQARADKALSLVDAALGGVDWLASGAGRPFFAVGGTWRALAKLHMANQEYPLHMMQGYAVPAATIMNFCEQIRKTKKFAAIAGAQTVTKSRRDVLPYGALVLERLLRQVKPSQVIFSVYGIREGLVYKLLSKTERERDPLIAFATDYADRMSRSLAHAQELCAWTDPLFGPGGPAETPGERRLRHAACLLSDVAWRAHPDYRGEQSVAGVAHGAMAGIDHPGRMFLAMACYFRHAGPGSKADEVADLSNRLAALLPARQLERARIIGAAVRAAHMLSMGRAGIIDEIPLSYDKDSLVVPIPASYAALDGERLRRRFATLAELLGKSLAMRSAA